MPGASNPEGQNPSLSPDYAATRKRWEGKGERLMGVATVRQEGLGGRRLEEAGRGGRRGQRFFF